MVQSLPGFLNLCLNVCSPCQVLGDVYTEVLEAAHPLHRGPANQKRSVGLLLSLPEVHDQLFGFAHVQREAVVLAPWCKSFLILKLELQKGQVIITQFTQQKWQPFWWVLIGSRKYSELKVGKAISGSQCWHVDLPQKGLWFFITGVSNSVPGWVRFQPCSNTQSL